MNEQSEMAAQSAMPEPLLEPKPANIQPGSSGGKAAVGALVLFAFSGIAVGLLPMPGFWQSQGPAPTPPGIEQNAQRAVGPSLIRPVLATELQQAIDGMLISDGDKTRLREEMASGKTRAGWLTVSDSDAEDGDQVTILSGGVSQTVRLFHKPTTVAIPYASGVPAIVTGNVDGDGKGITVAVHMGATTFALAPMQVGTSVRVPTP
jgi:hypothetical protein